MLHPGTPRVVITGIGVVSPFGIGRERFWDHVRGGCSATRTITDFDASTFGCRVAAPVSNLAVALSISNPRTNSVRLSK